MEFKLKPIEEIETEQEAKSLAIEYQNWDIENDLSYGDLTYYGNYFNELGIKFNILDEFKENGIC